MSAQKKTDKSLSKRSGFERIEKLHPYKTLLFFALVGSTLVFLSMSFLYFLTITRTGNPEGFTLPKIFSVSTVTLLMSSYFIAGSAKAFSDDSFNRIKLSLGGTVILGIIFCALQIYGWLQLAEAGFFIKTNVGVSYLYVITAIHFVHVAGGIIYLTYLSWSVHNQSKDIAKSLLYLTDEMQRTRLQLATVYWHFIDALWVLLFFMFLFSY